MNGTIRQTCPFQGWNENQWARYKERGAFFQEMPHYERITASDIIQMEQRANRYGWRLLSRLTVHNGVVPYLVPAIWEQQTQWLFILEERCLILHLKYQETTSDQYRYSVKFNQEEKPEDMKVRGFLEGNITLVSNDMEKGALVVNGWILEVGLVTDAEQPSPIHQAEIPHWDIHGFGGSCFDRVYHKRMRCLTDNFSDALCDNFWEAWLLLIPGLKKTPFPEIQGGFIMDFYAFPGTDNRTKESALMAWKCELDVWVKYGKIPGMKEIFPYTYGTIFDHEIKYECRELRNLTGMIAEYWDETQNIWKEGEKHSCWKEKIRLNPNLDF